MSGLPLFRWDAPGPYVVAFTTRIGGVSDGPYASLNLGRKTGDDVRRVDRNRALLCGELGLDGERLALNFQMHSATANHAEPGARAEPGDALWTEERDVPMLALAADCVPLALARAGAEPALAVVHAGWRGLAAGVVGAAVDALGGDGLAAIVGPAIGPCCYEVGPQVADRFDEDLTRAGRLDLWSAAERALRVAGCAAIERVDLCTRCNSDLFFSHRRDGKPRGVQGVIGAIV